MFCGRTRKLLAIIVRTTQYHYGYHYKVTRWLDRIYCGSRKVSTIITISITIVYYQNYCRATWWLDRIFCGRTRCHLAKFYESLHLLTDWEFVLGIQIIATTATEGNMLGKIKKNYVTCVPQILNAFTLKILNHEQLLLCAAVAIYNRKSMCVFTS